MPTERVQRQIDRLLDQVEDAVAERDWQLVRELCDSVLRLDHDNQDARTFLEAAEHDTGIGVATAPSEPPEPRPEADQDRPESGREIRRGFATRGPGNRSRRPPGRSV